MHEREPTSIGFDVRTTLSQVFAGARLSTVEAREVMGQLMDGALSQMQAAALLAALRTRGETVDEIIGFAQAMRERAIPVPCRVEGPLLDTCGTGGTGINTINISTAATFVAAAAGVRIAKHGNRGVTKRSGSADVLEALGVRLELAPERLARAVSEIGMAFIFARHHHPAMRFVAPIRADLGARTIFNNLGPLTNPAGVTRQLLGVYDPAWTEPLARVLHGLGLERALVVHGDGLDDFSLSGPTIVAELHPDGRVERYAVTPEELGVASAPVTAILGGNAQENARITREILAGERGGPQRDVVALGAGASLYLAGLAATLPAGVAQAQELLARGVGAELLERYVAFSHAGDS
jgi:anthranilate phosphoribosyltransferase